MRIARNVVLLLALLAQLALAEPLQGETRIPNLGIVKAQITDYVTGGQYHREVAQVTDRAIAYLRENLPRFRDGKPALVLDIDETSITSYSLYKDLDFAYLPEQWQKWVESAQAPALPGTLELYQFAVEQGMAVIFLTGRAESQRPFTEKQLRNAGFLQWDQLILRAPGQTAPAAVFKAAERRKLMEQGYTIVVNVGDQYSDLEGGYADSIFKLPNPMYHVP